VTFPGHGGSRSCERHKGAATVAVHRDRRPHRIRVEITGDDFDATTRHIHTVQRRHTAYVRRESEQPASFR
jgi:hypothetical protein